jgi:hypothetical protein
VHDRRFGYREPFRQAAGVCGPGLVSIVSRIESPRAVRSKSSRLTKPIMTAERMLSGLSAVGPRAIRRLPFVFVTGRPDGMITASENHDLFEHRIKAVILARWPF